MFEDSVRARWNEGAQHEDYLRRVEQVEKLRPLVREDRSLVDLALQFTLAHPAVTCPIPGMKSPEQAHRNAAADGELSAEALAQIDVVCPAG